MLHQEFEPPEELRHAIKCFWHNRRDLGTAPFSFEVLPDGYAEIIFYFGGACSLSCGGRSRVLPSLFIMGLLNQPILIHAQGRFEVIGIRCYPWTVFELLGLSPGIDQVYIIQHGLARLHPGLARWIAAGRVDQALAEVVQYFRTQRPRATTDQMLSRAGAAMSEANGSLPVGQVAAAAHATVRTLERKFRLSSGHTVKTVSSLMRFEQVRNRLWLTPASSLASLAHELGYTDQSHLSREFKRYSGTTPSAFARKAKQERAAASDIVAFVQA